MIVPRVRRLPRSTNDNFFDATFGFGGLPDIADYPLRLPAGHQSDVWWECALRSSTSWKSCSSSVARAKDLARKFWTSFLDAANDRAISDYVIVVLDAPAGFLERQVGHGASFNQVCRVAVGGRAAFLVSRRYGPHQGSPPGVAEKNIAEPRRSNLSVARQSAACPTASAEKCQTVRV